MPADGIPRQNPMRSVGPTWLAFLTAAGLVVYLQVDSSLHGRALAIVAVYLVLALGELVAPFVPTLFLLVAIPIALGPHASRFELSAVLKWVSDPVLALFAGGFALGLAAQRHGLDSAFAQLLLRASGSSKRALIASTSIATAALSMWMSNIAACALMISTLNPLLESSVDSKLRRGLLLAVAIGANLGGMATPLGTGPNGIAIAAVREAEPIGFMRWMSFGVPIAAGMLLLGIALLVARYRISGTHTLVLAPATRPSRSARLLLGLFAATVAAWLTEPLHGVSAASIALALTLALFITGLLDQSDLGAIDWSTLGLIAGGLALGRLLEHTGLLHAVASALELGSQPRWLWLGALVVASAGLAAVMSNTGTAAILVPLGLSIDSSASTAIIIAIAASFGMPFPISTPPNAMVYGRGGVRVRDLLAIGLPLMLLGCLVVTLSGGLFLEVLGLD